MRLTLLFVCGLFSSPAALAQLLQPPVPAENPITEAKRVLGKALFWDEQLSSDDTIACGTCHISSVGGGDPRSGPDFVNPGPDGVAGTRDDLFGSVGVMRQDVNRDFVPDEVFGFTPQVTGRTAATPIAAAYFDDLFWDGRATGEFIDPESGATLIQSGGALESQALGPILSTTEMACDGRTWDDVRAKLEGAEPLALAWDLPPDLQAALAGVSSYSELFDSAFGDPAITAARIAFAIATYERTLVPNQSPYDYFARGNFDALTERQEAGFNAFWHNQARCISCHIPPLFADGSYRNVGRRPIEEDEGRSAITGEHSDRGKFKVPTLRNSGLRTALFHDGRAKNIFEAVTFYNSEIRHPQNVDPEMAAISMPTEMVRNVSEFVGDALTDPRVALEEFPFDRPKLNSERFPRNPELLPGERMGSGGYAPAMIALAPPHVGSNDFKVGVFNALGGADAFLVVSLTPPGAPGWSRTYAAKLAGQGVGAGYGTFKLPIPADASLIGLETWLQFRVLDPRAAGGFALSPVAHVTLF
ncbi:MAG: hypothetical protein GY711_14880 [bacterium]|nr:hypothetical protein [bacterium]